MSTLELITGLKAQIFECIERDEPTYAETLLHALTVLRSIRDRKNK